MFGLARACVGARWRIAISAAVLSFLRAAGGAYAEPPPPASVDDLRGLSIEQLANVEVTSVSKTAEPLSDAAAAVYVISRDDIVRSGATTAPEVLRLAPNLQVAVITASSYAITARGFNGNAADKLLVLVDGRSVYTPLFGGVLWDEVDVPLDDIDHIEVISGPGATLWGANAVNGVINIITRKSSDAPGGLLALDAGTRATTASIEYGGRLASDLSYRVYADGLSMIGDKTSTGAPADDAWSRTQGGFRLDWTPVADTVSLQGDILGADERQPGTPDAHIAAANLQLSWQHPLANGSSLQLESYVDENQSYVRGYGGYALETYDLELQQSFTLGDRQAFIWGAGGRLYADQFRNEGLVVYLPATSVEGLADIFAQDTIAITAPVKLTLGLKLEKDPYTGVAGLPNARLAWKVGDEALLWAAASRAVRAPTLFDEDLQDTVAPSILILEGDRHFKPESLTAYEVGARLRLNDIASLSVSTFYNQYNDLRSVEWARATSLPLLLRWGNTLYGDTYGIEAWADLQPTSWWRLTPSVTLEHEDLRFRPGASAVNNTDEAGDDPNVEADLKSLVRLGPKVSWVADLRYTGALPDPQIPAYTELNTSLTWDVNSRVQLAVSGANLLNPHHLEYEEAGATIGDEVERSVSVRAKVRF